MSANDAEVTEQDRAEAARAMDLGTYSLERDDSIGDWVRTGKDDIVEPKMRAVAQSIANARRDAYRAGQIAGLEEAKMHIKQLTSGAIEWKSIDARIRELKGET